MARVAREHQARDCSRGRFTNCLRLCAPFWGPQNEPALVRLAELLHRVLN